jgi:UDP-3-O-[3-hydroxymyristoyl] glucosamine N-acyltransferase
VILKRIADILGCPLDPQDAGRIIERIASPQDADERSITFVSDPKYAHLAEQSKACAVIVKKGSTIAGKIILQVQDPYLGFAKVAQLFEDVSPLFDGPIHPQASIHPTAKLHETVFIGPYSVVGKGCAIGKGTIVGANCVIENNTVIGESCRIDSGAIIRRQCTIGNRVIIQSGAVVGGEGFGNAKDGDRYVRIPSFSGVVIEDDAEVGANVTIDRGTLTPTVIGKGVKIDNLVMIAHNVTVDENAAIVAQAGISGSTHIGKRAVLAGQAGLVGHIEIGDDAFVGAKAGVAKSVEKGGKVTGYPARDFMTMRRIEAAQAQLPELLREFKRLRADVDALKAALLQHRDNAAEL